MILVVDFGSQTAHLIGRRLRQFGVTARYCNPNDVLSAIEEGKPKGIILSGGPASVYEDGAPTVPKIIFEFGIPILGICYGWQLTAWLLGGKVENTTKEYGPETVTLTNATSIFVLPKKEFTVIVSHGDSVTTLPSGFTVAGSSKTVVNSAVADLKRNIFGVQFHPEADHTEYGMELLKNFATRACKEVYKPLMLSPSKIINVIKETVKDAKVVCAVSGGVDSTVMVYMVQKAVGKNCIPVYVDSGLMRPNTKLRLENIFPNIVNADLIIIEAKNRFLESLVSVIEPEEKRKTIGKLYIDIFREAADKYNSVKFLAQGTIYSDVIESKGSMHASKIKSHHNVGGLPKDIPLTLLEPLRRLYKDEVRTLAKLVGLPEEIINEHPFPGPGYAVRIRGEVTGKRLEQETIADRIVIEEMKQAGLYDKLFQCFPVMTGAYSTAVKGDGRVFAEVVAIRAYESRDIMTSKWAHVPYEVLEKISSRIVNEVPDVSRVVYDITTKPPATMEWE
jgi:GMP synthase (glutamine-hydrolysing)